MPRRYLPSLTLAAVLVAPVAAGAHGTDKPGPHGGEIRMPGAFHVEVVAKAEAEALRLYLLNMQFEQPQISDSSVRVVLEQQGETVELDCSIADGAKAFTCPLPNDASLQRGTMKVDATRVGKPASTARYELPLDFQNERQASTG